ncbi:hypothetical protein O6H91_Y408300 [Diphasiastrum complanatum]|nr:hypothetical protein O6H91_Y408300 [Diphasiastrum complanatum]
MAPKKMEKKSPTTEEKKIKAQMVALKAEEARKKKEAAERAQLRDLQKKEQEFSRENILEVHMGWRKLLRIAKVESMHNDIQLLSAQHEHQVNLIICKDFRRLFLILYDKFT